MAKLLSTALPSFFHMLAGVLLAAGVAAAADDAGPPVNYSEQIKPILSGRCYACHGPDAAQRKADLELHVPDKATREAIVPGDAAGSPLVERITSPDPELLMPPPDSKKPPLTAEEIELVKRWINEGAKFDAHWSYIKPRRSALPAVKNQAWPQNPLDYFIAARHEEHGLAHAAAADRRTLIRRLSFDLTGLPPQPAELDAFLADERGNAYEELVDRLLASPQFGERMAAYWLDVVRYADSAGYHSDNDRQVWLYRDYVIAAFNDDMPFDRFTIEQLAGDLLPGATRQQRIASGYNRLLQTTEEGGAQPKEYTAKYSADRVRNTAAAWLGATLGCAECHDHKFDPYTTKDFYRMAAFFADISERAVGRQEPTPLPTADQEVQLKRLEVELAQARTELGQPLPELAAAQAEWERELRDRKVAWTTLTAQASGLPGGAMFKPLDDGSILATGASLEKDTYLLSAPLTVSGATALRLEVLPDDSLPAHGPGRAGNGNFVLHEVEVSVNGAAVAWSAVSASHSQDGWPAAAATDGKPETGWAILPQVGKTNELVLESSGDLDGTAMLTIKLHQNYGGSHTLGRFRLSATASPRPVRAAGVETLPKDVVAALAIDAAARTDEQKRTIETHYRTIAPVLKPLRDKLASLEKQKDDLVKSAPTSLVSTSVEPRMVRVLPRGNWLDDSGEVMSPGTPAFLPGLDVGGPRASRLDLARWFVSRDNPLVARVFVNRLWKLCFGQGIVRTLDDFGTQGAWPLHPSLLDWLAVEFIESGWDVKHLLRLMVTSSTYRQSSDAPTARERDPGNQWLARQNRFRLDAEMVRDNALAVSGLLSTKIGGPSVKPYQPTGYWMHLNFPTREWSHDHGENQYRRGLYTWWQRTFLHPSLLAFDATSREECTVDRPRSNTPLQALVLLNDPTYVEAARALAARVIGGAPADVSARAAFAWRRVLGREATPDELRALAALYEKTRQSYAAEPAAAGELLRNGELLQSGEVQPAAADAIELATWATVCRAILNVHETVTRY